MSNPSQIELRNLNRKEHERTLDDKKFAIWNIGILLSMKEMIEKWAVSDRGKHGIHLKVLNQEAHLVVLTEVLALVVLLNF